MESVRSMRLRKTCQKCGAVVHEKRAVQVMIVAMPWRVKGGHVAKKQSQVRIYSSGRMRRVNFSTRQALSGIGSPSMEAVGSRRREDATTSMYPTHVHIFGRYIMPSMQTNTYK